MGRFVGVRRTLALVLVLAGCGDTIVDATLAVEVLPQCAPPESRRAVRVSAVGGFVPGDLTTVTRTEPEPGTADLPVEGLPLESRAFKVVATAGNSREEWRGLRLYDGRAGDLPVLVLPGDGRSCPRPGSSLAGLLEGSAVAATSDGTLVAIGGLIDERTQLRFVALPPGAGAAVRVPLDLRRSSARNDMTATVVDGRIVVAGGTSGNSSEDALSTIEVFDEAGNLFDTALMCGEQERCGRRSHSAIALADGRVLIVGGVSGAGDSAVDVDDAIVFNPATLVVEHRVALPHAMMYPTLGLLEDGLVVVIDAYRKEGVPRDGEVDVLVFDPVEVRFRPVVDEWRTALQLHLHPESVGIALPGGRFLWIGDVQPNDAVVLNRVYDNFSLIEMHMSSLPQAIPLGLAGVQLLALDDGTVFATANEGGNARAYRIDVGRSGPTSSVVTTALTPSVCVGCDTAQAPRGLVSLADGSIAELFTGEVSMRRVTFNTPYDALPTTLDFTGENTVLSFDVSVNWDIDATTARVRPQRTGRVDFGRYLFQSFELEIRRTGGLDLLIVRDGAVPKVVSIGTDRIGVDDCEIDATPGDYVRVTRNGPSLVLRTGESAAEVDGRTDCILEEDLGDHEIGLALQGTAGTTINEIKIRRL